LIDSVTSIRSIRAEMNVPPATQAPLFVVGASEQTQDRLQRHEAAFKRLSRLSSIELAATAPKGSVQIPMGEATGCLPLGSLIDIDAERARLGKTLDKIDADMRNVMGKLGNERFVANAKPEVVEAERERQSALEGERATINAALARLAEL
jgi:valyl-tRNA synthetase